MIQECQSHQDLRQLLTDSQRRPVFLFKHSSRCPISASVWREVQDFECACSEADFWRVLVIENKSLSAQVAAETGIRHQSPQALLFYKGQVIWHKSHWDISQKALQDALKQIVES